MRRVGLFLLGAGFVAVSWNAVYVSGLQLGDILLGLAFLTLTLYDLTRRSLATLPGPLWLGASLIALAGLLSEFDPPSSAYLASRYVGLTSTYSATLGTAGGNLTQLAKFLVALVILPLTVALAMPTVKEIRRLADLWVLSGLISSIVAFTDNLGVTAISQRLQGVNYLIVGQGYEFNRQSGLTSQPNHLAVMTTMALPIVFSWFLRGRKWIVLGAVGTVIIGVGVYLSGSRGGLVAAMLAGLLCVLLVGAMRRKLLAILMLVMIFVVFQANSVVTVIRNLISGRYANGGSGDQSDLERSMSRQVAIHDFQHSPVFGIGYNALTGGHLVELQLLSAGGLILFVGYFVYQLGVLSSVGVAKMAEPVLAQALLVSILTLFALGLVENQIADRYLFVPAALLVALAAEAVATRPRVLNATLSPTSPKSVPSSPSAADRQTRRITVE